MYLTAETLPSFLIDNGIVSTEKILEPNIQINITERRNRSYIVRFPNKPNFLVKQIKHDFDETRGNIFQENYVLKKFSEEKKYEYLHKISPNFVFYDYSRSIIVIDFLEETNPLDKLCYLEGAKRPDPMAVQLGIPADIPTGIATRIGSYLAKIHTVGFHALHDRAFTAALPHRMPWSIPLIDRIRRGVCRTPMSQGLAQRLAQFPALGDLGRHAAMEWSPSCLIHGDLKLEHILIHPTATNDVPEMTFVDWELSDIGDPAFDLASLFYSICSWSLLSWSHINRVHPHEIEQTIVKYLPGTRNAVKAVWSGYLAEMKDKDGWDAAATLDKTMLYLPLRYIQGAVELGAGSNRPPISSEKAIQSAVDITASFDNAIRALFGTDRAALLSL